MIAASEKPTAFRWRLAGLFAVVSWVVVGVTGSDVTYYLAAGSTVSLAQEGARRWARSKGVPEWAANEAYITRLRRWRRARNTSGGA
jgi:hypothetical protein